jgi:cyclic beta-1,2-glucan synthetase
VLRHLLGLHPHGDRLELCPHLPSDWNDAELSITLKDTPLRISIKRGTPALTVDGAPAPFVPLDGKEHHVELTIEQSK